MPVQKSYWISFSCFRWKLWKPSVKKTLNAIWRSVLKSNYSENKCSEFPNGSGTHDLPEYGLDTLVYNLAHHESSMSCPIDLFRLYILLSQYRSCDDTQEIWSFVLFIKVSMNMSACTLFNEQNKGSNLLSIITWSVLGQQNVQAKKVYLLVIQQDNIIIL